MNLNRKISVSMFLLVALVGGMNLLEYSYASGSSGLNSTSENYTTGAVTEIFTKQDFSYGPQSWKPYGSELPIKPDDGSGKYDIMFIDLFAAPIGKLPDLIDNGAVKVEYWFTNYEGSAAFHVYGYCEKSNHGRGIEWTNSVKAEGGSGYYLEGTGETNPKLPKTQELADINHIHVRVANDNGAKYDDYGNDTYYMKFGNTGGGLNSLHITTDPDVPSGQVTVTGNRSGVFYISDTGGRGFDDNAILMVAVDGTVTEDFELYIRSSGYRSPRGML